MQTKASEFEMNTATILANLTTTIFNYAEAVNQQMTGAKQANDKLVKENVELVKKLDDMAGWDTHEKELPKEAQPKVDSELPVKKSVKQED